MRSCSGRVRTTFAACWKPKAVDDGALEMNGYNFTDRVRKVLQMAREEAARLHHEYVGTEHILLGLIREGEGVAAAVLTNLNVDLEEIQQKIEETVKKGKTAAGAATVGRGAAETWRFGGGEVPAPPAGAGPGAQPTTPKSEKKSKTPALDHFCRDLTQLAVEGQLDPTIGRFKEIERVMEILSRRKKNNPVLIGEPGVGKTAIVEGLAQLIAGGECPDARKSHPVLSADMAAVIGGTKYRRQFEERRQAVDNEIAQHKHNNRGIDQLD